VMSTTAEIGCPSETLPADIRRILWSSVIGASIEWYDFLVYAAATALVFNKLFFPTLNGHLGSIAAFGAYAAGLLARPVGALIFGHFGDRLGRKPMLITTMLIMGAGTFLIGLLPTYYQVGVAAPVLLVVLRLLQGIGMGGEWAAAVLMVFENASAERRGLMTSMVQMGNPIGHIMVSGLFSIVALLPEPAFLAWGWRVPFLVSIAVVGVGLWIRLQLDETPSYLEVRRTGQIARIPIVEVIRHYPRSFLTAVGLKISDIAYATIGGIFVIAYVTRHLGLSRELALSAVLVANLTALAFIPLFGWLSDQVGRRPMFYAGCLFCGAFAFPLFWLLDTRDPALIILTVTLIICFGEMLMFSVGASWYAELFDARVRYTGISFGFQVGSTISGGLTPLIAESLLSPTNVATWPISLYLISCACVTAFAAWAAPIIKSSDEG
jgi:MFS transporter, MHS family, shikimate and dehydroshikimate transport protein